MQIIHAFMVKYEKSYKLKNRIIMLVKSDYPKAYGETIKTNFCR